MVLNADMQGEGRGTFLCLLGVCLIAIAAAAALPWSMEPRLSDHHRSGVRREVGVEPISCNEYSHFKLPAQSAANKHLNSATQHYLTFPWWFKWNCVARGTLVPVIDTHNFITLYRIEEWLLAFKHLRTNCDCAWSGMCFIEKSSRGHRRDGHTILK